MPTQEFIIGEEDLDCIVLTSLKKGKFLPVVDSLINEDEKSVHYDVKNIRALAKEIYKLYSKKATRKEFFDVIEKHRRIRSNEIENFMNKIENMPEEGMVKVLDRKESKGVITIKLKKINPNEKKKYVKSIAKQLVKKVSREQLEQLFEQSLSKLNDLQQLKRVHKKLKKTKPKVEGSRGCYKFIIDGEDIQVVS